MYGGALETNKDGGVQTHRLAQCSFSKVCDDCLDDFSRSNLKECRKWCSSLFKSTRYVFTSSLRGGKVSRNDQVGPRDNEQYHHL